MESPELRTFTLIALAITSSGCVHRPVVDGPPPPEVTKVVRIDVSGGNLQHAIADPAVIAEVVRWFAAGPWQIHNGPLPDPIYTIEFQGSGGLLAKYTASSVGCLWISCPGWIGVETSDGQRLIRRLGEDAYMSFVFTLRKGQVVSEATTEAVSLQGTWRIAISDGVPLPAACENITLEIGPATIRSRSGTLEMTTAYEVIVNEGKITLRQSSLTHNGGENCQGISAEYVVEHFAHDLDADVIEDRLRLYLPSRESGQYTEFVRSLDSQVNR